MPLLGRGRFLGHRVHHTSLVLNFSLIHASADMLWGVVLFCEHNALCVRVACVIQITLDIRANDFLDAVTERACRANISELMPEQSDHTLMFTDLVV